MTKQISEERLRHTRSWAAARIGSLSGAEVIVGAIDELLERRAADPCATPVSATHKVTDVPGLRSWIEWPKQELDELLETAADEIERLRSALSAARGQWIHSVNAKQCLEALGEPQSGLVGDADRLREEIEVLRLYGNKDCTDMADSELERRRAARTEHAG